MQACLKTRNLQCLGRSPLGGRNWEGFSADPYLSSVGSYISVVGFQDTGVVATSKHYILYEQETQRNPYRPPPEYNVTHHPTPISSDIGDVRPGSLNIFPSVLIISLMFRPRCTKHTYSLSQKPSERVPARSCVLTTASMVPTAARTPKPSTGFSKASLITKDTSCPTGSRNGRTTAPH